MAKPTDRVRNSTAKSAAAPKAASKASLAKAKPKPAARHRVASEPATLPPADQVPAQRHDAARIVLFSCQWAPHYAFQSLYRRGRRGEGDAVRVLTACVGRVGEDLVLEAFRQGADGVAVLSCPPERCRHGLDHGKLQARLASLRRILATLGIPAEQLLVGAFHPHEGERLAAEIAAFAARVEAATAAGRASAGRREGGR